MVGVTLITVTIGVHPIMDTAGIIHIMAGVIPDMVGAILFMGITIIIHIILVEEVLLMLMVQMATDILKTNLILMELGTIRIQEEALQVALQETVPPL
jgi:hypothetical protein